MMLIIIAITIMIIFRHQVTIANKWSDHPRETEPVSTKWKWWKLGPVIITAQKLTDYLRETEPVSTKWINCDEN